ncbi:hypothetical protein DICPUDRAFT_158081 [Dictyostelium purpureum]|uniref:Protein kinase domain-containing protein n=1 Tax=Dictyostelium purpureum TaxID=5786 RepID=F1A0S6_DICPU|nr:uncharacterized protein DICPUDRAFT_158081 [Dictyostelium purpureum]EGC30211.1 hypothetical protein DICPUDRAFT_158081 [Dictyostelium purpureum]|eukprot:XP_003293274.1 hypothetical protein DICPUDRAFT_158081 [Dictyostelium purpureum]
MLIIHSYNWSIDYSKPLGKGALSEGVYKATLNDTDVIDKNIPSVCSIKILNLNEHKTYKAEIEAIDNLLKLSPHENIIKFYGYGYKGDKLYIYMEYLDGYKTIKDLVKEYYYLAELDIVPVANKIIDALDYLHRNHIIHRDIKCENIMLNPKDGTLKLIDFGTSKYLNNSSTHTTTGTKSHMAPEIRSLNKQYSFQTDIWSLGSTLIEMAKGDPSDKDEKGFPKIPNDISKEYTEFVQRCLILEPDARPSTSDLKNHIFLKIKLYDKQSIAPPKLPCNEIKMDSLSDSIASVTLSTNGPIKPFSLPSAVKSLTLPTFNHSIKCIQDISITLTELTLPLFNQLIDPLWLPIISIKSITLDSFNQPFLLFSFPFSTTSLKLRSFNQPIEPYSIPPLIKSLILESFNQPIDFPTRYFSPIEYSITSLTLPSFNQFIKPKIISPSITSIKFEIFNQPISPDTFPPSITELIMPSFNQTITQGSIPPSVKTLVLGSFNQTFKLKSNTSSQKINKISNLLIPSSVTSLRLELFNQPITTKTFPSSITELILPSFNQTINTGSIPSKLKSLKLKSFNRSIPSKTIPISVTKLRLPSFNQIIKPKFIPPITKSLSLSFNQHITPDLIPSSVTSLTLISFNQPIPPNSFSNGLTSLKLPSFNQDLDVDSIPPTIKTLVFGESFRFNEYGGNLPDTIKNFTCLYNFGKPFKKNNNIPKKVSILSLDNYNHPITKDCIPSTCHTLTLGSKFNFQHIKSFTNLPATITNLSFGISDGILTDDQIKKLIPASVLDIKIRKQKKKNKKK